MSWRWEGGQEDPNESRVEIALKPIPGGTEITLTHTLLSDEDTCRAHKEGWSGSLDKLQTLFAGSPAHRGGHLNLS
jgi:uncharacterized protein YndB with AHSA1/START domain